MQESRWGWRISFPISQRTLSTAPCRPRVTQFSATQCRRAMAFPDHLQSPRDRGLNKLVIREGLAGGQHQAGAEVRSALGVIRCLGVREKENRGRREEGCEMIGAADRDART